MKKGILLIAVFLLCAGAVAQSAEGELSGTLDVTYVSRYIWRGFDVYSKNDSAIQPSIDVDLYGTGFGLNVWMSQQATSDKHVNAEEIDYTVYYGDSLFEGESYATNYAVGWVYYSYPDMPRSGGSDAMEIFAGFSWPNLCPAGIVPSYTYIYMWQADGGGKSGFRQAEGSIHVFGLGYDVAVPAIVEGTAEQVLNLSVAAVYNDGTGGAGVKHDWSHAVFGVSTGFDLGNSLTLTPGVYYQSSWEDTVNTSDEYWASVSLAYAF